jgi:predicted dehydrogenase
MKLGVVGLGHLGKILLKVLHQLPEYSLSGVYDIDNDLTQNIAQQYQTKACESFEKLVSECDVLAIITPTSTHYELAKTAILNKKHVFIEKPATYSPEESIELYNLAKKNQVNVQIGHIERYNPAFISAKPYLENIKYIKAERLAQYNVRGTDVSVVMDLTLHDLDIILSLIKKPIINIKAEGSKQISSSIDKVSIQIEFENHLMVHILTDRANLENKREIDFTTDKHEIKCDLLNKKLWIKNLHSNTDDFQEIVVNPSNALVEEYRDFYKSITIQKPISICLNEAAIILKTIKGIENQLV